ncbi:hypothetical protein NE237_001839 [Protea cynaroides]|uniref:Uncharacterized protein n=1 Tax=Protea cynaroides TaxID=273540 RepID=A0A9Q0KTV7_9MAGN|nr:hypothetical protein NE237_001839 [Protea cynaroides]
MVDDSGMPAVRLLSGSSGAEMMAAVKLASTTHRSLGWRLYDQTVISSAEGGSRMTTGPCQQSLARVSTGGMQLGSRVSMAVDLEAMNFWFVLGGSVSTVKLHVRSTDERQAPQQGTVKSSLLAEAVPMSCDGGGRFVREDRDSGLGVTMADRYIWIPRWCSVPVAMDLLQVVQGYPKVPSRGVADVSRSKSFGYILRHYRM